MLLRTRLPLLLALLAIGPASPRASTAAVEAEAFERKVVEIAVHGSTDRPAPKRTTISQVETNAWFATRAGQWLPDGVAAPAMTLDGAGLVTGTAVVDLDAVAAQRRKGGALDPWSLVGGRVPVTVQGVVHTSGGRGRFELRRAEVSGFPVPAALVVEAVAYYTRSDAHPSGLRLEDEFALPSQIQHLEIGRGQVVVVQ